MNVGALSDGVLFDLFGTGAKVTTAWISSGDGLLFLDRNGNGTVDGAAELFGNVTAGVSHDDGFQALAELDANGDGTVDARDPAFRELRVWRDENHDGVSQPGELHTLEELSIRALSLGATRHDGAASWDVNGNQIPLVSSFVRADGTKGLLVDAYMRFKP